MIRGISEEKISLAINGKIKNLKIVPSGCGNLTQNKISVDAPLIQLIIGRKEGEVVQGMVPGGKIRVEIRKITKG